MTSQQAYTHETRTSDMHISSDTCSTVIHKANVFSLSIQRQKKTKQFKTLNPVKTGETIETQKSSKTRLHISRFEKHHSCHVFNKPRLDVGVNKHLESLFCRWQPAVTCLAAVSNLSLQSSLSTNIIKAFSSTHKLLTIQSISSAEYEVVRLFSRAKKKKSNAIISNFFTYLLFYFQSLNAIHDQTLDTTSYAIFFFLFFSTCVYILDKC